MKDEEKNKHSWQQTAAPGAAEASCLRPPQSGTSRGQIGWELHCSLETPANPDCTGSKSLKHRPSFTTRCGGNQLQTLPDALRIPVCPTRRLCRTSTDHSGSSLEATVMFWVKTRQGHLPQLNSSPTCVDSVEHCVTDPNSHKWPNCPFNPLEVEVLVQQRFLLAWFPDFSTAAVIISIWENSATARRSQLMWGFHLNSHSVFSSGSLWLLSLEAARYRKISPSLSLYISKVI